jgi:hypothetical protein
MKQHLELSLIRDSSNDKEDIKKVLPANDEIQLRFDWTNLERLSPLAKQIENMQTDCSIKKQGLFWHRDCCGLGSDLHVYSNALCLGLELRTVRVRSIGSWNWRDELHCSDFDNKEKYSSMKCYFPGSELQCPEDEDDDGGGGGGDNHSDFVSNDIFKAANLSHPDGFIYPSVCPTITEAAGGTSAVRAATTEFLFTRVSDLVQKEAQRQLQILFGKNTKANGKVPKNLITVHIRWGDKHHEMQIREIAAYIEAIQNILDSRKKIDENDGDVNILLATEDPEAMQQFMNEKPKHWNVYVDQYYTEYLPYRLKTGNVLNAHVENVVATKGQFGLVALGSLLVAMEANDFVLTTASNWSRMMNELRKNVIDLRCQNCTTMSDLGGGEYR